MSRMRKKCLRTEHKFGATFPGAYYVFCARWFCDASAVAVYAPPHLAAMMHNAIPEDCRWPPVELNEHDGTIARVLDTPATRYRG